MSVDLTSLSVLNDLPFDDIIDVRAPSEFAEDHIAGAVNLPVLSDAERAEVGTIYVQDSPFKARKIGAALVSRNAARHLETFLADKPGGYRPLVYCWRGGQRSGSFTTILQQVGWRAETLKGGYRTYRRLVQSQLYEDTFPCPVLLLDGDTGSGKTDLLNRLPEQGLQVLDLEGLAHHRGSLLGAFAEGQPTQKTFESRLARAIAGLDASKPVVIEAESSKIGRINLPPSVWRAMKAAPRLVISVPRAARAEFLVRSYADILASPDELIARLDPLRKQHGHAVVAEWQAMAKDGRYAVLADDLMAVHYDPLYRRSRKEKPSETLALDQNVLSNAHIDATARVVAKRLSQMCQADPELSPQASADDLR